MHISHRVESIAERNVAINPISQPDFGFGWALRVQGETERETLFSVVIECAEEPSKQNQEHVLEIGRKLVEEHIQHEDFEVEQKYCYNWHSAKGLLEIDCSKRPKVIPLNRNHD